MAAQNNSGKVSGKKGTGKAAARKKRKQKRIALLAVEAVVVVVLIAALYLVTKLDYVHKTEVDEDEVTNTTQESEDLLVDEDAIAINDAASAHMAGYRNIALFGVDSRNENLGKGCRTDTILIASINETTKDVKLVSIYRDTYLNQGNDSYKKANSAYASGGPQQAIKMLNMNLDMNITDYVTVGWAGVADTIDALGGVEIEVDDEEISHLNNYQVETSDSLGRSYKKVTSTGLQTLDGIQAVSYCRIRYTAGDDYKRTERQREVIKAIADKAKKASPKTLDKIANDVFPQTATSLKLTEILNLVSDVASYNIADTSGFPSEQYRTTGVIGGNGDCVIPTPLSDGVLELHTFLFGDTGEYQPSSTVEEISEKIHSDTGK